MQRTWSIYRSIAVLAVTTLVLFGLSGIPAIKNAEHGWKFVVGDISWFGFLLSALVLLVVSAVALFQRARRGPVTA